MDHFYMDHPMNVVLVTQLGLPLPLRPRPLPPVQVFSYVISTTLTCTLPESQTSCNARGLPVVASFPPGLAVLPAANSCPYGVERRLKRAKHASCICPILSVLILTMHGNISFSSSKFSFSVVSSTGSTISPPDPHSSCP